METPHPFIYFLEDNLEYNEEKNVFSQSTVANFLMDINNTKAQNFQYVLSATIFCSVLSNTEYNEKNSTTEKAESLNVRAEKAESTEVRLNPLVPQVWSRHRQHPEACLPPTLALSGLVKSVCTLSRPQRFVYILAFEKHWFIINCVVN